MCTYVDLSFTRTSPLLYHYVFPLSSCPPLFFIFCIIHAKEAETPTVISLYGFSHNVFAASLLIMGLGGSFSPCCANDDCRGGRARHRRGFWLFLLLVLCNAVPPPHHQHHPHHQQHHAIPTNPAISSSLNQSRCLFNYWEQRGSLTNSSSRPSNSPISRFFIPLTPSFPPS